MVATEHATHLYRTRQVGRETLWSQKTPSVPFLRLVDSACPIRKGPFAGWGTMPRALSGWPCCCWCKLDVGSWLKWNRAKGNKSKKKRGERRRNSLDCNFWLFIIWWQQRCRLQAQSSSSPSWDLRDIPWPHAAKIDSNSTLAIVPEATRAFESQEWLAPIQTVHPYVENMFDLVSGYSIGTHQSTFKPGFLTQGRRVQASTCRAPPLDRLNFHPQVSERSIVTIVWTLLLIQVLLRTPFDSVARKSGKWNG